MKQRTLSILVDNTAGVLSRLSGLFSRRAYNIDSISAGVTADPRYTRITVVATGDDDLVLDQITNQVRKQVDVRDVKVLDPKNSVNRELMLIKIRCEAEERQNVISLADVFRANIIEVGRHSLIIELVGGASKLSAFLELLDGYEILELARTGITGLSRGMEDVRYLEDLEK